MDWKVITKKSETSGKKGVFSSKGKKALLLTGLFALVIAAGYLNYSVTTGAWSGGKESTAASADAQQTSSGLDGDVFATFRQERETMREQELTYIESVVSSAETDDATKTDAQAQKLALAANMEKELLCEGQIKTSMGLDAVVSVSSALVSAVVGTEELSDEQAGKISQILSDQTGVAAQNIKIIPQSSEKAEKTEKK